MGFRAHTITQHRDYGHSVFYDWREFLTYFGSLSDNYEVYDFHSNDAEDYFEVGKEVVKQEIERIRKLKPEGKFKADGEELDYTNEEFADTLQESLDESPEDSGYVTWEWF